MITTHRTNREFLCVTLEHPFQIQLFDLTLHPAGQPGQHRRPARQYDMFVEVAAYVDVARLDRVEE